MAVGEATTTRSSVFRYLVLAAVLLAGLVAGLFLADRRATPAFTHATDDPSGPIRTIRVDPAPDRDKAGSVHGVMSWRFFEVPAGTSGQCPDELRFEFSAPAEIRQIDVSIDINDPRLTLVEFAAAINSTRGFGQYRSADWLMMTSWSRSPQTPGEIDETVSLPPGVQVDAGDFVGISGWMGGVGEGDRLRVSPEVVVLYRWL